MRLNEASKILSEEFQDYVTDSFIRCYDKYFLKLKRTRNGKKRYREVSNADLKKLRKIYVFSKIGIPVKTMEDYFNGSGEAHDAITKRKKEIVKILDGGLLDEF